MRVLSPCVPPGRAGTPQRGVPTIGNEKAAAKTAGLLFENGNLKMPIALLGQLPPEDGHSKAQQFCKTKNYTDAAPMALRCRGYRR
jgi:hypothetical protein